GRPSDPFALVDPVPAGATVTWSVEPASAAGLAPLAPVATSVTLFPAVAGALTLVATVTDAAGKVTHRGSFATTAVAAPTASTASTLDLPWVGQGVGTLVVTVMILGIVLYLANEAVIDGAVV